MNNRFSLIKNIFQEGDEFDYVTLDKSVLTYEKLVKSLKKPLKLILFHGKPGVGKTFLLRKIYENLYKTENIVYYSQPFFDENTFLSSLYEDIFNIQLEEKIKGYEDFLKCFHEKIGKEKKVYIILLDEAQLYPKDLIEKIRLLADTRSFKFLFTVHKTSNEDLLAKDYFTTRIWESVEMPNSTLKEVQTYLDKKLSIHKQHEIFSMFNKKHFDIIFKLTNGNLRTINKFLYKFFEICEYYESVKPSYLVGNTTKHLEMAAIDTGLIDA